MDLKTVSLSLDRKRMAFLCKFKNQTFIYNLAGQDIIPKTKSIFHLYF